VSLRARGSGGNRCSRRSVSLAAWLTLRPTRVRGAKGRGWREIESSRSHVAASTPPGVRTPRAAACVSCFACSVRENDEGEGCSTPAAWRLAVRRWRPELLPLCDSGTGALTAVTMLFHILRCHTLAILPRSWETAGVAAFLLLGSSRQRPRERWRVGDSPIPCRTAGPSAAVDVASPAAGDHHVVPTQRRGVRCTCCLLCGAACGHKTRPSRGRWARALWRRRLACCFKSHAVSLPSSSCTCAVIRAHCRTLSLRFAPITFRFEGERTSIMLRGKLRVTALKYVIFSHIFPMKAFIFTMHMYREDMSHRSRPSLVDPHHMRRPRAGGGAIWGAACNV
jgi:hypothetical protein